MANTPIKDERVKVWPEMVLRESLAAMLALAILIPLSMFIQAPLESIADPSFSVNPSKAPWYFLGLQEMLVYFTPWVAGVAVPVAVVFGLMAIPYLDVAQRIDARPVFRFERSGRLAFTLGLLLWVMLTVVALFFRGKNWSLQWLDGTPLGSGSPIVLDWVVPTVIVGYVLAAIACRFSRFRKEIKMFGIWRLCLSHLLAMAGLAIFLKIVLHAFLELTFRS